MNRRGRSGSAPYQADLARAKAKGKKLGRPRVSLEVEKAVLAARAEGKGMNKIARKLGIGVSTVQRIVNDEAPKRR